MKKSLIFCSLLVLTACLLTLSVFASAGSDYIDYRAEQEAEERAELPKIVGDKYSYGELFEEDAGTEHDNYDPKNYIRVYKMQSISKDTLRIYARASFLLQSFYPTITIIRTFTPILIGVPMR